MPANKFRDTVTIENQSGTTVYLGGPKVTATNGLPLPTGSAWSSDTSGDVWGITGGGSLTVAWWETNQD